MSKLLQSSTEDGPHGEIASSNGKVPFMPPHQARSELLVSQEWGLQVKETPFNEGPSSSPPPVEASPVPANDGLGQYAFGFEVDV